MLALAVALMVLVNAITTCGPGGPTIRNPNFRFQFSPPVGWTYYQNALKGAVPTGTTYPGQMGSLVDAQITVQNALTLSVLKALNTLGFSATGYNITYGGYTPPDILIQDGPTATVAGSYIAGAGAVLMQRTTANSGVGIPVVQTMTVMVRNTRAATLSEWRYLADLAYQHLLLNEKVFFRSTITVF